MHLTKTTAALQSMPASVPESLRKLLSWIAFITSLIFWSRDLLVYALKCDHCLGHGSAGRHPRCDQFYRIWGDSWKLRLFITSGAFKKWAVEIRTWPNSASSTQTSRRLWTWDGIQARMLCHSQFYRKTLGLATQWPNTVRTRYHMNW